MKHDVGEAPVEVPKKRRHLESAPDVWLAQWLSRDSLTPSERRRVEDVRKQRRSQTPELVLGLLIPLSGVTPQQLSVLGSLIESSGATAIHHGGVSSRLHSACRAKAPVVREPQVPGQDKDKSIVRASDRVLAAPQMTYTPVSKDGVWAGVKYAKHRGVRVTVVLPDGSIEQEAST